MAWLAVDKDGAEFLYLAKPERVSHRNAFRIRELDFEIWSSNKNMLPLVEGSIKNLIGRELKWEDEPVEI